MPAWEYLEQRRGPTDAERLQNRLLVELPEDCGEACSYCKTAVDYVIGADGMFVKTCKLWACVLCVKEQRPRKQSALYCCKHCQASHWKTHRSQHRVCV